MKYSSELYAKAFMEVVSKASKEKQGKMVSRFLNIVRKNGDYPLIKKIFNQIQEALIRAKGGRMVILESARQISPELMEKLKNRFSVRDRVEQVIRPDLAAGLRVLVDGEKEIDFTLKRKLRKLFNVA